MSEASPEWTDSAVMGSAPPSASGLIVRALREPRVAIREGRAILKGLWCRVWFRLRGYRFTAGRNLRIDGKLVLRGPGAVILGDNVRIGMTVTPWTYAVDAVITIGDGSFVNGTSFACAREIKIGRRAILGRSSIMDTDFHSVRADRHDPAASVRVEPVVIEDNVWVAAQVGILPGSRIGANSVVGFGAVCAGVFPANVIIAGNPAKIIKSVAE